MSDLADAPLRLSADTAGMTNLRFPKSLRRLLAGAALVAAVTVGAAAPALAHPPDPCAKPASAVSVSRAS
jgi:hypothetical protein